MVFRVVERRLVWFAISGIFIMLGFGLMGFRLFRGEPILNFGADFSGGTSLMLRVPAFSEGVAGESEIAKIRKALGNLAASSVIQITRDQELIIKTRYLEADQSADIQQNLSQLYGSVEVLEVDFVGPTMGQELRRKSVWIILGVSILLMGYITWRFDFSYGMGALMSVVHDAFLVVAFASLFSLEINMIFLAALLTILGYSINDTIVIFDRIRENIARQKTEFQLPALIGQSIKETLGRTINTGVSVILVLLALIFLGGSTTREFSIVLLWGVIVGTYSSLFIASPIFAYFYRPEGVVSPTMR